MVKTGIDIIEVDRIKSSVERYGEDFLKRVFTVNEIEYCEKRNSSRFQSYAARFAAKEAVFKALSECLDNKFDVQWVDIEIINDENGRPCARLYGDLKNSVDKMVESKNLSGFEIDISISHVKEMAIASVIVMCTLK